MGFLKRFRKSKTKAIEPEKEPKKSLEELLEEYKGEYFLLDFAAQEYRGNVPEHLYNNLRKIEEEMISFLPDEFQKAVFRIFSRHKFDIVDFFRGEDWKKTFFELCRDICHFLYWGSPYPMESEWVKPPPFSGEDFFLWFLAEAKSREGKDRHTNILKTITEATDKEKKTMEILGHEFKEEQLISIGGRIITVFFGGWGKKPEVLIDIFCEVEGGEKFIKGILENVKKEREAKKEV